MNEPTREQFSPQEQNDADELLRQKEMESVRKELDKFHRPEHETVNDRAEALRKRIAAEHSTDGVHHEVSPDFALPEKPIANPELAAKRLSELIEKGGEAYGLNKELEDLFDQDRAS